MGRCTKENGSDHISKERVSVYIWMDPNTKDYGTKIKDMATVDISSKMVKLLKENGSTTK